MILVNVMCFILLSNTFNSVRNNSFSNQNINKRNYRVSCAFTVTLNDNMSYWLYKIEVSKQY